MIVALHHQHDVLANHEVRILVLIGVVAHTGHAVREVAENAAAIFAGDHRKAAGAYGVALLRTKEGVDFRFFRGNNQFTSTGGDTPLQCSRSLSPGGTPCEDPGWPHSGSLFGSYQGRSHNSPQGSGVGRLPASCR